MGGLLELGFLMATLVEIAGRIRSKPPEAQIAEKAIGPGKVGTDGYPILTQ
jgi:hypothetical protein